MRVVIFGECMLELVSGDEDSLRKSFAGDTYNTAVYLKRCANKTSVHYFTAIGADFLSSELLLRMDEEQINSEYVLRNEQLSLGLYMVRTDKQGERSFAYWRDNSAATQCLNVLAGKTIDAELFYFSGISMAILDDSQRNALFDLLTSLKQSACKIVFDPNYRARLWQNVELARHWTDKAYALSDICFPGGDDHLALYGHTDVETIYAHLKPFNIDEIIVKNGAVAVHILHNGKHLIVPVEHVEKVVDTTAAGDAFNAGYLASRLSGGSLTDAASYAAKVAATVICYPGAIMPRALFSKGIKPLS